MKRFEPIDGEVILADEPIHWKNYIGSLCVLLLTALLLGVRTGKPDGCLLDWLPAGERLNDATRMILGHIELVIYFVALGAAYLRLAKVYFIRYYLTSKRIIVTTGFFTVRTVEMLIQRCETVNLKQNVVERLFGCADITCLAPGSSILLLDVKRAAEFKKLIMSYLTFVRDNGTDKGEEFLQTLKQK